MMKAQVKFTYEDYCQLPEDKRYELIGGEFFMVPSPSPYHQDILRNLLGALNAYVVDQALGKVYCAPLDVVLSDEDVVQPDILFISKDRVDIIGERSIRGAPDLVVEILSPATAERDRTLRKKLYAKYGVRECWLVDPESEAVEVFQLGERGFESVSRYEGEGVVKSAILEGLAIPLGEIFD
ncbi:MAG: Uma2 family endonuclease [bacterium]